jgi:uncharacterized protein
MEEELLYKKLLPAAEAYYRAEDPSHDWEHICRVFAYAHYIWEREGGDFEIISAGALFHDCVNLPKNDPRSSQSADLSAEEAGKVLSNIPEFPQSKVEAVKTCIREHSLSKGLRATTLESMIVQDADRLESTGIISLMRTFSSCGIMGGPFFDWKDPLCERHIPDGKKFGVDLIFSRLLKVSGTMNTKTARTLGTQSDERIRKFVGLLKEELTKFPTDPDYWRGKLPRTDL